MAITPASIQDLRLTNDTPRRTKRKNTDESDSQDVHSSGRPQKRKYYTRATRRRVQGGTPKPMQKPTRAEYVQAVSQQGSYVPDHKFYYEDGDLFVTIQNNNTLFLVHREKLVNLGGLFEDTLAGDLVRLDFRLYSLDHAPLPSFVSVRAFRFLLAYLYSTIHISKELPDGTGWVYFEAAIALIEISEQLALSKPRVAAVTALKYLFPSTFNFQKVTIAGYKLHEEEMFHRIFPISAVNVITEYSLQALKPMAFYYASQLPMSDLFNGVRSGDGKSGPLHKISDWRAFQQIMKGRERLQASRRQVLFEWLEVPVTRNELLSGQCEQRQMKSKETCLGFLGHVYDQFRETEFLDGRCGALIALSPQGYELFEQHLCEVCWPVAEQKIYEAALKNWLKLPEYFDLPSWEALQELE